MRTQLDVLPMVIAGALILAGSIRGLWTRKIPFIAADDKLTRRKAWVFWPALFLAVLTGGIMLAAGTMMLLQGR